MNILILGNGGREHAIAEKVVTSPLCDRLLVAPGNAGTMAIARNVDLDLNDFAAIKAVVEKEMIGLVIVGPEAPLVDGIVDYFQEDPFLKNIPIIGPGKLGAQLEGSKDFAKEFMLNHQIPTAQHATFTKYQLEAALSYLDKHTIPVVLKADGLAAGKGVVICDSIAEAKAELTAMLSGKFGEASSKVVIEQFLDGKEFSMFVVTDGKEYVQLAAAKDYKRIGEGETGPNTGGMGAISPVPFLDEDMCERVKDLILDPTINGLHADGIPYTGFLFFGLIMVGRSPYVIEYNCRLGDPESEVVLPRLQTDLVEILMAAWNKTLPSVTVENDSRAAATIVLVSSGYPGEYEKGKTISCLDLVDGSRIYHAATKLNPPHIQTMGGRVMAVTSLSANMQRAIDKSLRNAEVIEFEGKYYRKDIGQDVLVVGSSE